jgi:hypothetical protein
MAEISSSGELYDVPDIDSLSVPKRKKSLRDGSRLEAEAGLGRVFGAVRAASLFLLLCCCALSRWTIRPQSVFRSLFRQPCSTKSGTTDSPKKVVLYFMPFRTYNRLLIPVLLQIIEMRHLSD